MLAATADDYIALCVLLLVAVGIGFSYYFQRKRLKDLERVAQELGFHFQAEEGDLPAHICDTLPVFQRSRSRSNFLQGRRVTGEIVLADVRVGSGKQSYSQTVASFHLFERQLPAFELSPESWARKIAQAFGYKDINFDSSPEFSKSYLLRGQDETAARELFRADLLHFFTGEKGWSVEGAGDWLCVYRYARTVSPKDIRSFLDQTEAVARLFAQRTS